MAYRLGNEVILKNAYISKKFELKIYGLIPDSLPIETKIPKNKKILLYAGNLGIAQDQELVLKIIDKMQDQDDYFPFCRA